MGNDRALKIYHWTITYYPPRDNSVVYEIIGIREDDIIVECTQLQFIGRDIYLLIEWGRGVLGKCHDAT